jgi:hypothetical protein
MSTAETSEKHAPLEESAAAPVTGTSLTDLQLQVIDLLCAGASYQYVVEKLSVSRTTLYRWRTEDREFQRAYERRRAEIVEERRLRVVRLIDGALDVVDENLREGDPDIAMDILRMIGPEALRHCMDPSRGIAAAEVPEVGEQEEPEAAPPPVN